MQVTLNEEETNTLMMQKPTTQDDGGFQQLMVRLQKKLDNKTGNLELNDDDLKKIPQYAAYTSGGWQKRFKTIFSRVLGPNLGG